MVAERMAARNEGKYVDAPEPYLSRGACGWGRRLVGSWSVIARQRLNLLLTSRSQWVVRGNPMSLCLDGGC